MALSDEMRRLTQQFGEAHEARTVAVAGIRTQTAEKLSEYHAGHDDMAAEQRQQLAEYVGGLSRDVRALLKDLDVAHNNMAAEQNQQLAEYVGGLRRDVSALLKDLDVAHNAVAAQQSRQLAEYVGGLRRDVSALLKDLDVAHNAMAAEQRQWLSADRSHLASDVAAMRGELQADLGEAGRLWSNFNVLMQQRRAGRPAVLPQPLTVMEVPPVAEAPPPRPMEEVAPPPAVEAPPEVVAEEAAPDDLMVIRGIGISMQDRLNQAGIYTYAQLAQSTVQELRRALGEQARLANVEEWIEQARERAGLT